MRWLASCLYDGNPVDAGDQSRGCREPKESLKTAQILFIESEVDIFAQVAFQLHRGNPKLRRSLSANLVQLTKAQVTRALEVVDDLFIDNLGASRPDGQNGGQVGHATPFFHDVVDVESVGAGDSHAGGATDLFAGHA